MTIEPRTDAVQLSGNDGEGKPILAVIAKRRYFVDERGRLEADPTPAVLVEEPLDDPDRPGELLADTDLWPWKPATDVVVRGRAYGRDRETMFLAGIQVGEHRATVRICGARRADLDAAGRVVFTPPQAAGVVPLDLSLSYGGRDAIAEAAIGNPYAELADQLGGSVDGSAMSPFLYPRNPLGCGFVVDPTREAIIAATLPQIEDPEDLLTPARFLCGEPANWLSMPLPANLGWLPYDSFLRLACLAMIPPGRPPERPPLEVKRGWLPHGVLEHRTPTVADAFRFAQGAWPALRTPPPRPGTQVHLDRLHPRQTLWSFAIPAAPDLRVDGRKPGKLIATKPQLHSLIIEPDAGTMTVVWRGSARALRPYGSEELKAMPFSLRWND